MERCYVGLDVGTSGAKASVMDSSGKVLFTGFREYRLEFPGKGLVELNPNMVWARVRELLAEIGASGLRPEYLAFSSIGESMVLLDKEDRVLCNGITYLDERGPETVDRIKEDFGGERIRRITGLPVSIFFSLNRWLWLRDHCPSVIDRTQKAFLFGDYMTYLLTGERMIDPSTASKTLMMNAGTRQWDPEICGAFGIPSDRFSRIVPVGTCAGKIRPALARELNLPEDLKVVVGIHDQGAATLGAGTVRRGDIAAGEGSTESLNLLAYQSDITDVFYTRHLQTEPYLFPDSFLVPAGQHAHGTSLRWFVEELGADFGEASRRSGESLFDQAAANCAEDSAEVMCLPYLTRANLMDPDQRSLGIFLGLELGTKRSQMYRALLEGLCFETRCCLDELRSCGLPVGRIVAAGGCTKSELYMQLKADILQEPIHVLEKADAGTMALAMICAVSAGDYAGYEQAAEQFVHIRKTFCPERDYTEKMEKYRVIRDTAKELYSKI